MIDGIMRADEATEEMEGDEEVVAEAEEVIAGLVVLAEKRQLESLLSGEADGNDCFLEVHAGAGGTEAQDWAAAPTLHHHLAGNYSADDIVYATTETLLRYLVRSYPSTAFALVEGVRGDWILF